MRAVADRKSSDRSSRRTAGAPSSGRVADKILIERDGPLARLVINRPPLNILDIETIKVFSGHLRALCSASDVHLIEVRGAGKKAFCAGTDIREHFPERASELLQEFHALLRAVLYASKPTMAVVRGHCLGGGIELALACDFILAAKDSRFGQPEIKLGVFPPAAAVLLPRLISQKRSLEMILTGKSISASQAEKWGLVNGVAASQNLDRAAQEFSRSLLSLNPLALGLARKAARLGSRETLESALRETERIYLSELLPTPDATEGLRAFLEKRPPKWSSS